MLGISILAFIPVVLLRERVRADLARQVGVVGRASSCSISSSASWSRRRSAAACSTGSGPSVPSCSAARSPRSASGSGRRRSPTSASAQQSGSSSLPARAWASCSARRAPTPSTAPRGSPTARRPGSPRPSATTAASLGFAILGSLLVSQMQLARRPPRSSAQGLSHAAASAEAKSIPQSHRRHMVAIPHFVRLDFADATARVLMRWPS